MGKYRILRTSGKCRPQHSHLGLIWSNYYCDLGGYACKILDVREFEGFVEAKKFIDEQKKEEFSLGKWLRSKLEAKIDCNI